MWSPLTDQFLQKQACMLPSVNSSLATKKADRGADPGPCSLAWHRFFLLALMVVGSTATLVLLLKYSHFGIDFTDESFYLTWLANPYLYDASVSQFGFIYHPLYRLLDGDVASLRQANILITFGLASCATGAVLNSGVPTRHLNLVPRAVVSLGLASGALALFSTWLPTPSYNSLNLQSLLVTATGLAWSCGDRASTRFWGHLLVGAGGWLALMAKPSTALALAVFVLLFWLTTRRLGLRSLLGSATTACLLLMVTAFWIDGSIGAFTSRLTKGLEVAGQLGGGHTIANVFRLDAFKLSAQEQLLFLASATIAFACALLLGSQRSGWRLIGLGVASAMALFVVLWMSGAIEHDLKLGKFQNLLYAAVPLAALLFVLTRWLRNLSGPAPLSAKTLLLIGLPFLAYAYAFGTNGNYWSTSAFAAFFWLMPALLPATSPDERLDPVLSLAPFVLATQVTTALVLQTGMERPYRQMQPLRLNGQAVEFGQPGSTLMLSDPYADYLNTAKGMARASGLAPGTPMIDLSGQSPGILYALQAHSLGLAWMIGGYPGSARLAAFALASVPCEKLAQAWILSEPGGPRSLPDEVLGVIGGDLALHYRQVGTWMTTPGSGNNRQPRRQLLWQPARDPLQALQACETAQNKGAR